MASWAHPLPMPIAPVPTGAVRKLSAPHLLPLLGVCSQQKKEVQLPRPRSPTVNLWQLCLNCLKNLIKMLAAPLVKIFVQCAPLLESVGNPVRIEGVLAGLRNAVTATSC